MVALKKFFQQQERNPSRPSTSPGLGANGLNEQPYFGGDSKNFESSQLSPGLPSPGLFAPGLRASQSLDVAHHFEQIEKQFEDLHQHLSGARPLSSQSQLPPSTSNCFAIPRLQNSRHIDLLDAILTQHRQQEANSQHLSPPSSPYNEDVAERNMTRFLRVQHRNGSASSKILSALYQEDVADRNIAKYGGPSRSLSSLSCRSSPPAPGRVRSLSPGGQKKGPAKRNVSNADRASDGNLRKRISKQSSAGGSSARSSQISRSSSQLRPQRSAPSLSGEEENTTQEEAVPAAVQRLGVPPAYKQGKRWSNTPLPDSPTLPMPLSDSSDGNASNSKPAGGLSASRPPVATARSSSLTPRSLSPPSSSGTPARKNKRDLSINVQLASSGRPKIAHRAIQPPTPSSYELKRAPSIAQVMNSPLPVPSPQPSPRYKASEMMEMFNKAYMSIHAVSPHPTYETLQDAIVREINSHELFRSVPVPSAGPPFTPSPTQDAYEHRLNRSASAGNISKIMRKSSFKKHKRDPESRRSISTSVPSNILRRVGSSPARRRHTDAPFPSPALIADIQASQESAPRSGNGNQLTYMDVLLCASNDKPSPSGPWSTLIPRKRGRSHSASNLSTIARANSERPFTPGAVYTMQAHSTSSDTSPSSNSNSHDESDDDVIHLPSVGGQPRVQIEGVDENNVRYVIDSTAAADAHKLMQWPQRGRANTPQPTSKGCDNTLAPGSRGRVQLRGARSVETY